MVVLFAVQWSRASSPDIFVVKERVFYWKTKKIEERMIKIEKHIIIGNQPGI